MRKRFLTTACFMAALPALALMPLPAKADFVRYLTGPDADDVKMFINDTKAPTMEFTGSTTGNGSHSTESIVVDTPVTVTTASGFANIKPAGGLLTSLLFTPNTNPPKGQGPFVFDGFFTRAQLQFNGTGTAPATTNVFMDVNGGGTVAGGVTFSFTETLPEKNDFADIGFDEPQKQIGVDKKGNPIFADDESKASLIKSVRLYVTDTDISFFEVKQINWSPCTSDGGCGVVINPTGSVPEISTWSMMIAGFFGIGGITMLRRRQGERPFRLA